MKKFTMITFIIFVLYAQVSYGEMEYTSYTAYKSYIFYSFGELNLKNIYPTANFVQIPPSDPRGNYFYKIGSFKDNILEKRDFSIPLTLFYDTFNETSGQITGGGSYQLNETDFTLLTPYYPNAKSIEIYDKNQTLLLSIDVSPYSQCNENSVCEAGESNETCLSDCKAGVQPGGAFSIPIEVLGSAGIIILAALFFLFRKKSSPQTEPANL